MSSWETDFDDADLLDIHTSAAYRYATVAQPHLDKDEGGAENRGNGAPSSSSGAHKRSAKLESFSSLNNKKLASMFRETTGTNPARKKKRKKKKAAAEVSGGLHERPGSAPGVATRRVPTSDNDSTWHALDGSKNINLQTVTPFTPSHLTHLEMMHTGLQAAIPSSHKHSMTYVQRLGTADDMVAAGPGFRKPIDFRNSTSKDKKQVRVCVCVSL